MIKVRLIDFKGKKYVDIRKFFVDKNDATNVIPTKKGIALPIKELGSVITELEKIEFALPKEEEK